MPATSLPLPANVIPLQAVNPIRTAFGENVDAQSVHDVEPNVPAAPAAPTTSSPLRDMLRRKAQEKLNARDSK